MSKAKIRKVYFLIFCVLTLFSYGVSFGDGKETLSKGVGDLSLLSEASARNSAIEDALRNAVEQVVGIFISSESLAENFVLLSDHVYSKSSGYIKSYRIVKERKEQGLYIIEIAAKVGMDDVKNDLEAIGILISRMHNPRIMVIMGESISRGSLKSCENHSVSENTIVDQFLSKEFKVVDAEASKKTLKRDQLLHMLEGDNELAARIGLQNNAEIVIVGKATAQPSKNIMGTKIKSFHANISAKAIRTDTAEIIASDTVSCTSADVDETTGVQKAFREAGKKLCNVLIEKILDKWKTETNVSIVELTISGLSTFSDLVEVKKIIMQKVRGVKDIYQKSFTSGVAKVEVRLRGDINAFTEALVEQKIGSEKLEINDITHNKIQAKIVKIAKDMP